MNAQSLRSPAEVLQVEVAYAEPHQQMVLRFPLHDALTVEALIRKSGILERFPDIDLTSASVGIFGKPCALNQPVRPGDRIEIYRPLIVDPRTARQQRAQRR